MSRVTSKLQVTLPKKIAEKHGIQPGTEIFFESGREGLRVKLPCEPPVRARLSLDEKLRLFDEATQRQKRRDRRFAGRKPPADRGWKREDLYRRGMAH